MAGTKDDVDFEGLELISMRLEIDTEGLLRYLEAHSDFPAVNARYVRLSIDQSVVPDDIDGEKQQGERAQCQQTDDQTAPH